MLRIVRSGLLDQEAVLPDVLPHVLKGQETIAEDPRAARRRARRG
jgi:hypothetical protein